MRTSLRRLALAGAGAAVVTMGVLSGCSSTKEEPPATTTTTPSSATSAVVSPTEKALSPTGDNSFSPTVNPTPKGGTCIRIVNGVCMR